MKRAISEILKGEGFISDFAMLSEGPQGDFACSSSTARRRRKSSPDLRRISRPGLRVYAAKTEIPRVLGGLGLVIISTTQGHHVRESSAKNSRRRRRGPGICVVISS